MFFNLSGNLQHPCCLIHIQVILWWSVRCSNRERVKQVSIYLSVLLANARVSDLLFRLIVVGYKSSKGYVAKFPFNSLALMTDFTTTTSIDMSISTDTFTSIAVTLTSQSDTVTSYTSSITVQDATYISAIQFIPDVYNQTNSQAYSLIESTSITKTPDITWSFSGSTAITYSIENYLTQAPSWVSIDPTSGQLSIVAPSVTTDTTYSFYINSAASGSISQKVISVTVLSWAVESCSTCSSSASICSVCNTGYSLTTSGICLTNTATASESAKAQVATNQAVTGAMSWITGVLGLSNVSSLGNLWSMLGQIQLLFFLLLTNAYIPIDIKTVITSSGFLLNLGDLFSPEDFPFYSKFIEHFYFEVNNSNFEDFGLKSNSSFYNTISLFATFILTILLHIFLILMRNLFNRCGPWISFWWCPLRLTIWFIDKVVIMLTYSIYIRFILQATQFWLIACIYEIYLFKLSQLYHIVSFAFAVLLLSGIIALIGIVIYLSLSSYSTYDEFHNNIGEFFVGIQMDRKFKFYSALMLIRKLLFAAVFVFWMHMNSLPIIIILWFIELFYFTYLVVIRPFKEIKGNMIEIINEIFFFFFLSILLYLNEQSKWTSTITSVYSYTITSNNIITLIIISCK